MSKFPYSVCVVTIWHSAPGDVHFTGHEIDPSRLVDGFDLLSGLRTKDTAVVQAFDGRSLVFVYGEEGYDFPVDDNIYRTEGIACKDGGEQYLTVEWSE